MSTGKSMFCMGKERNVRHLVGQPERGCSENVGGNGEILLRQTLYRDSQYFCTIDPFERLMKPTDYSSEKYIVVN
jgi:hypothetical protein